MLYTASKRHHLTLILLLLFPMPALAMPAINCHCFTDRSFDPKKPAAADPYFLATTQNSFFAFVFNTDKKTIVIKKQQGTSPDDLWIAYWVASKSGTAPETLLQTRLENETWKSVLAPLRLTTKALGSRFYNALDAKQSAASLAEIVVDELLFRHQLLGEVELAAMRQLGASSKELIIAAVIANKTKQSARQIYLEVKNGTKTWGSLLKWANIDTKNMQQEISSLRKKQPT
ncbi:MAG: hypothetical protein HGA20_15710 [Geobacteraceae bacterium]|nr:hypothetical protein [Geobacteraceae bacterium]